MVLKFGLYLFFANVSFMLYTNLLICAFSSTPKNAILLPFKPKFYFYIFIKLLYNSVYNLESTHYQTERLNTWRNFDYKLIRFLNNGWSITHQPVQVQSRTSRVRSQGKTKNHRLIQIHRVWSRLQNQRYSLH